MLVPLGNHGYRCRMGKRHGSEGQRSIKIAPQNSLTQLLKPIENGDFSYFFLIENCDFSYFFLPSAAAAPSVQKTAAGWENTMAVKDGEASKLHPKTP